MIVENLVKWASDNERLILVLRLWMILMAKTHFLRSPAESRNKKWSVNLGGPKLTAQMLITQNLDFSYKM